MAGSLILPAENLEESKNSKSINRLIKKAGKSKYDSAIEHTGSHYRQNEESLCASDPGGLKLTNCKAINNAVLYKNLGVHVCTKIIYRIWQCYQILNLINDFFMIVEQNAIYF